jgi:hypothetical protein
VNTVVDLGIPQSQGNFLKNLSKCSYLLPIGDSASGDIAL